MTQRERDQVIEESSLEEKWETYEGTGINARKGEDTLVLRKGFPDGDEFAIVKVFGGSRIMVLEEIKTTELEEAKARFDEVATKLGFEAQKRRSILHL